MLRKIVLSALALLSPLMLAVPARAQSALLFGQKHYYSVTFRANEEAIVYARIVITNNGSAPVSTVKFTNGDAEISELTALQMVLPPACEKYRTFMPTTESVPACEKYGDPDYTSTYSYNPDGEQTEYFSLKTDKQARDFTLTLQKPIEASKSGAVVLAYVSKDYVNKDIFGVKNYDFKTLGAETRQSDTVIAIDVDGGLVLKGADEDMDGGVRPLEGIASIAMDASGERSKAIINKTLDSTVAGIGSGGKKSETATGVAPNEQFSAKGSYAESSWKLFAKVTLIVIFAVLASIVVGILLIVMLVRRVFRGHKKSHSEKTDK